MMQKLTLLTLICSLAILSGCKKEFPVTPDPFTNNKEILLQEEWKLVALTIINTQTGQTTDGYASAEPCKKTDKVVFEEEENALQVRLPGCNVSNLNPGLYEVNTSNLNLTGKLSLKKDNTTYEFGQITQIDETTLTVENKIGNTLYVSVYHNRRKFKVTR